MDLSFKSVSYLFAGHSHRKEVGTNFSGKLLEVSLTECHATKTAANKEVIDSATYLLLICAYVAIQIIISLLHFHLSVDAITVIMKSAELDRLGTPYYYETGRVCSRAHYNLVSVCHTHAS